MSLRPDHRERLHPAPPDPRSRRRTLLPAAYVAGAGSVLVQMAFPFTSGGTVLLTVLSVVLLATASVLHAAATRGASSAATLVLVAGAGGLLVEAVGVRTGVPFGDYAYTGSLGVQVLGVPLVVPLAWTMMAYPALLAARRLTAGIGRGRGPATALLTGWALTTWDVLLDPQMVDAGHWTWAHPDPGLPGVEGIPLSNFAGWLLVATVMGAALDRLVVRRPAGRPVMRPASRTGADALPVALFLWTYASSVLAQAVFFGRPSVALAGGLLMGTVALPLLGRLAAARGTTR